ncbi:hypothetical protein JCM33374_g1995 [Metschnikowia sp. JCM 33374]|nr:hypothetical protein JCM33374_g1995 [Metschnikowia sp. JCM 33374]
MSSFYPSTTQTSWRDPDICDILGPENGSPEYVPVSDNSQMQFQSNYIIPGFNPLAVQPPEIAARVPWSSPTDEICFEEANPAPPVPQYYTTNTAYDQNFPNSLLFETDSPSSISSSNGGVNSNYSASTVATVATGPVNVEPPQKETAARSKRSRVKVLDDVEAELIEKDDNLLTDAELAIKRRAQNRLAQRAFRERKESKLKDLQAQLVASEDERQKLSEKLEEIKSQFIVVTTENQALRFHPPKQNVGAGNDVVQSDTSTVQPQGFNFTFPASQEDFVEQMMSGSNHLVRKETVGKIYEEPQHPGQKVLAVGAVWDYLSVKIEEEEYENIDMMEVMQNLKGTEVCHGYGPAYPLSVVDSVLDAVVDQQR